MTEHVWKIKCVCDTIFAYVGKQGNYKATMSEKEILARLNEYETLKAATDALSAEDLFPEGFAIVHLNLDKLIAYANILEGKDA